MENSVIFIHGLSGSTEGTWGKMRKIVSDDKFFADFVIDFYSYPTSIIRIPFFKKSPSIYELAEGLRSHIRHHHSSAKRIFLVGHSLGGLVLKQFILSSHKVNENWNIAAAIMIATPHTGSSLANIGKNLSWRHSHLRQLARGGDLLRSMQEDWLALGIEEKVDSLYISGGIDAVVERHSSSPLGGAKYFDNLISYGHIDVIKPDGSDDIRYLAVKRFIAERSKNKKQDSPLPSHSRSPLFYRYETGCEEYYLSRSLDQLLESVLLRNNLWLSGPPGVGKTVAISRFVIKNNYRLFYFSLDGFVDPCAIGLLKGICTMLKSRLGSDADNPGLNHTVPQLLNDISKTIASIHSDSPIVIMIEEIPITSPVEYKAFMEIVYLLSLLKDTSGYMQRLIFVFTSVVDPQCYLDGVNKKIAERYDFIRTEYWTESEITSLSKILSNTLMIPIDKDTQTAILGAVSGSPRLLKSVFKKISLASGDCSNLTNILTTVKQENL